MVLIWHEILTLISSLLRKGGMCLDGQHLLCSTYHSHCEHISPKPLFFPR